MSDHNSVEVCAREKPPVSLPREKDSRRWQQHISSDELLSGRRELVIMHSDELYLLRVTSKGKLILTK